MFLKVSFFIFTLSGISSEQIDDLVKNNGISLTYPNTNRTLIASFVHAQIQSTKVVNADQVKTVFVRDPNGQSNYALVKTVSRSESLSHYSIDWFNPLPEEEFCVHTGGDHHWYSTYEEQTQRWPMDKNFTFKESFSVHDQAHNFIGGVLEHLFLRSDGFAFFIERKGPLFLRRDGNKGDPVLCFSGDYSKSPYINAIDKKETKLVFHLVAAHDILQVYKYASSKWYRKPTGVPDNRMIKYPIWSTWAKYHTDIDQNKVIEFAKEISSRGFPNSQLEIDDKWEAKYGDFEFDVKRFPNAKQMIDELKSMGFRSTVWVYPFVNIDSDAFSNSSQYVLKLRNGSVLTTEWWRGRGAHLDFTSSDARDWFVSRLTRLRNKIGLDSFKFDAGELAWIEPDFQFTNKTIQQNPNYFVKSYQETLIRLGNMAESRVAYNGQHLPYFIRIYDKESTWDYKGGLRSLIPAALAISIAGYPYVLPDMIGGNAYGNFPSKELYIRWIELNALMPAIQFSIVPWDFKEDSNEVVDVTKAMLKLHEQYTPLIIQLAENAVKTGEPIMRPVWWVAPNDTNTFAIDDQFLVGNNLLVAPVVHENARQRDIYLPEGQWKDHKGVIHKGPQTLKDYPADLHELPYFTKVN